jgi:hypothetical protein
VELHKDNNEYIENNDFKPASLLGLFVVALAISIVYTFVTHPPSFLLGRSGYWELQINDVSTYITGLRFYIRDKWHFPIFDVSGLNYPEGTNIIFTDSLPLMALLSKLLYKATGIEWNYFGFWFLISNICYGISIILFLDSVRIRSYFIGVVSLLLGFSSFVYVRRISHIALFSHFIILLSLSFYFYSTRKEYFRRVLRWFLVLLPVSLLIHVYLFAMASIIALVTVVRLWAKEDIRIKDTLKWLFLFSITIFVLAVCCGHVHLDDSVQFSLRNPSGRNGMNMLSPFTPSRFSPLFFDFYKDPTGKQFSEGMNYLGIGIIALWLFVFIKFRRNVLHAITTHPFLFIMCAVLWVFSFSHKIYFGEHLLLTIPKIPGPWFFYQLFRGNGRFFWPVVYLLILSPVVILWRHCPQKRLMIFILCTVILIQNLEIFNLRIIVRKRYGTAAKVANMSAYEDLVKGHELVLLYEDQSTTSGKHRPIARTVYFFAGKHGVPINYCYTARGQKETMTFEQLVSRAVSQGILTLCVLPQDEYIHSELNAYPNVDVFDGMVFVSIP